MEITIDNLNHLLATQLAPWLRQLEMKVTAFGDDYSVEMSMPLAADIIRPPGIVCGQAQMAYIDTAMLMSVWRVMGFPGNCTTVSQDTHFTKAGVGDVINARTRITKAGKQLVFGNVDLFNADGSQVASASLIYMVLA